MNGFEKLPKEINLLIFDKVLVEQDFMLHPMKFVCKRWENILKEKRLKNIFTFEFYKRIFSLDNRTFNSMLLHFVLQNVIKYDLLSSESKKTIIEKLILPDLLYTLIEIGINITLEDVIKYGSKVFIAKYARAIQLDKNYQRCFIVNHGTDYKFMKWAIQSNLFNIHYIIQDFAHTLIYEVDQSKILDVFDIFTNHYDLPDYVTNQILVNCIKKGYRDVLIDILSNSELYLPYVCCKELKKGNGKLNHEDLESWCGCSDINSLKRKRK